MDRYEEKMKALRVLKDAIDAVNTATAAIEAFAKANDMKPRAKTIGLFDLTDMVAEETGMKPECVYTALATGLGIIKDCNLTLVVEDEDDDE